MEEQKFRIGEIVFDTMRPGQQLIITKACGKLYYCTPKEYKNRKALVYAERELKGDQDH